ncbi:MAG: AAA family ATPase, partial [Candidatus Sericytochromatia bacterium]
MDAKIAERFTPLHPLGPHLTLVRDQDGTPRVLKRLARPDDPAARLRFQLEAWRASQLDGPRVAPAFGADPPDAGAPYYTMAYAQGPAATLVAPHELSEVLRQLTAALLELHRRGWVHGGLEPAHLRRTDGGLVLVGYGHLTPIGQRAHHPGHPDFQAPEQAHGLPLDGRADLYAVGALLHYWLTNRAHSRGAGQDALEGLDHPLVPLARRLLADRPADRLPDAAALLAQLELPMDAPPPVWVPPLVRRPAATALVEGLLGEIAGGAGVARRIEAPSGAGKTRFLDLADDLARRAGWPVARATGLGPLEPPLAPWESLFSAVAEAVDDRQTGLLTRFGTRLTPPRAGSLPAGLGAEGARLRWLTAAAEFLAAAAPPGLVLLLDDWHLADEGSRRALGHLRERLRHAPILWLVAGERLSISALALPPFSRDEGFALVAALLSGTMAGPDVEKLVAMATGNPWKLETAIALWRETGELRRERGHWVLAPGVEPAPDAERLAYLRANALPTIAWTVGGMAAMLAPLARPAELSALLDEPELLAEGLDALLRAGVLSDAPQGYRFTHAAYAALFLDAVSPERQDALRAQLLAAVPDTPNPAEARRWVEHALLGDRPDLTARLALLAAQDAIAAGGRSEARRLLEEGMVTLDTEHPDRGRYLAALAETCRGEGHWDEARALWDEAARVLPAGPERLDALLSLGAALDQLGLPATARDRYREALGHAQTHGDPDAMTLALVGLTGALGALGEAEEATVSGEAALGAASEAAALPRAAAMAALGAVLAVGPRDRQPEGVALLQRATALYEAEGDRLGLVAALGRL